MIADLVKRFEQQGGAYKSGQYNEAQLRKEFVDPMFEALGWDMQNRQGYAEQYKDVIHEDAIKIGGATKAPDYCFRIGGTRKFFLEAKKPSVDIKHDVTCRNRVCARAILPRWCWFIATTPATKWSSPLSTVTRLPC
ncbi:MAG: hypothetical protein WA269_09535 [Candidatus Udaeobacter sp.]